MLRIIVSLSLTFILTICGQLFAEDVSPSQYGPSPVLKENKTKQALEDDSDSYLLKYYEDSFVILEQFNYTWFESHVFDNKVRSKVIDSFNSGDRWLLEEFKRQFNGNVFDYNYTPSQRSLNYDMQYSDKERYDIRKAFARHVAKKVGEYHFNKWVKYHPRIKNVVKSVENIKIDVVLHTPSEAGRKPTKLKLKINPFKAEIKLKLENYWVDTETKFRISNGEFTVGMRRDTPIANFSFHYHIGYFKFKQNPTQGLWRQKNFSNTYSFSVNKVIFKDISTNIVVAGNGAYEGKILTAHSVRLGFSLPL